MSQQNKSAPAASGANSQSQEAQRKLARYDDLLFCVQTQGRVNTQMTGENWMDKARDLTESLDQPPPVDYVMASLDELAEFWASCINFKWWAKTDFQADIGNANVELVDILHFFLSLDLVHSESSSQVATKAAKALQELGERPSSGISLQNVRAAMKRVIHGITATSPTVDWKSFWEMAEGLGISPTVLIFKYRAKATLNRFRTAMGAAAGTYNKRWLSGKEDNYYLMLHIDSILALGEDYPGDEAIYEWLTHTYSKIGAKSTL